MQKTILYAVLNWGLGHATRSIPIIKELVSRGNRLIITSDGEALTLLQNEFPELEFEATNSYKVKYAPNAKDFNFTLAKQIPKFVHAIKEEHEDCLRLCTKHKIEYIISDNRYGFYHKTIPCAFICHQLFLRYPESKLIEKIVNKSYQSYLKEFTQLWVPDLAPPDNISGEMSKLNWKNVHYLGIDSRLDNINLALKHNYIAVLSGPEPQRSLLEAELYIKLNSTPGHHVLIRGTKESNKLASTSQVKIFDLLSTTKLNQLICSSETVICRSGYTSILDLIKLNKNAILIATPGQVEQEYLAKNLSKLNYFQVQTQGAIDLERAENTSRPELTFGYEFELIQSFLSC